MTNDDRYNTLQQHIREATLAVFNFASTYAVENPVMLRLRKLFYYSQAKLAINGLLTDYLPLNIASNVDKTNTQTDAELIFLFHAIQQIIDLLNLESDLENQRYFVFNYFQVYPKKRLTCLKYKHLKTSQPALTLNNYRDMRYQPNEQRYSNVEVDRNLTSLLSLVVNLKDVVFLSNHFLSQQNPSVIQHHHEMLKKDYIPSKRNLSISTKEVKINTVSECERKENDDNLIDMSIAEELDECHAELMNILQDIHILRSLEDNIIKEYLDFIEKKEDVTHQVEEYYTKWSEDNEKRKKEESENIRSMSHRSISPKKRRRKKTRSRSRRRKSKNKSKQQNADKTELDYVNAEENEELGELYVASNDININQQSKKPVRRRSSFYAMVYTVPTRNRYSLLRKDSFAT
ncbi:hypothetical protein SNEBB_011252 [Seison nebaliae]|nr:hypothetical protein SNEBB_011252 [Seison nebaliae]